MSNDVVTFENARLRRSRDSDPVRVNVRVEIDDPEIAARMGAKLALIRWQDECRRLNKLPKDGETVTIRVSDFAGERRRRDPADKAAELLRKLPAAERERVLRELGLL